MDVKHRDRKKDASTSASKSVVSSPVFQSRSTQCKMAKFEGYNWEKMHLVVELNSVLLYVLKNHEQGAQEDHLDFQMHLIVELNSVFFTSSKTMNREPRTTTSIFTQLLSSVHLNVLVDSFYTALFSALEQTSCALFACDLKRVAVTFHSAFFSIRRSGVLTALFSCYVADAT